MTTPTHDDELPRDPRFDAAWRAASNETPPPALDAAIRAAARREVGAGPQREVDSVREATRPERWWWPLAAAATIGAIAIGVLQTAPQERDATKAVVSDMPADAGAMGRRADDARKEAPGGAGRDAATLPPPAQRADESARASTAPRVAAKPAAGEPALARAPQPFPAGTGAAESASAVEGKTDALAKREVRANAAGGAEPAAATPAPKVAAVDNGGRMESATAPRAAKETAPSFVASPVPAAAAPPAAAAMAPPTASPIAPPAAGTIAAPGGARARSDAAAFAPAPPATPPREAEAAAPARQLAAAKVSAEQRADPAVDAKMKDRAQLPVPEWIALIRKLRDEGRTDDAVLELKAFRALYPDADARLPADLRDWPPGRR